MADLPEFLDEHVESLGYTGITLLMIAMAPELVMPFVGFAASQGYLSLTGGVVAGTLGGTLGSTLIYLIARSFGELRVRRLLARRGHYLLLRERDLDLTLDYFHRHGSITVLVGRFIPSVRSLVSVPAGLLPMPAGRFLLLTLVGTGLWNALLVYGGYMLGVYWIQLARIMGYYGAGTALLVAALLILFVMHRVGQKLLAAHARGE